MAGLLKSRAQRQIQYEAVKHTRLVIFERLLGSVFLALLITAITKTWLIR